MGNADAEIVGGRDAPVVDVRRTDRFAFAHPARAGRRVERGTLTLRSRCPATVLGSCAAAYRLTVPNNVPVTIRTDSGDVRLDGFRGSARIETLTGDVSASAYCGFALRARPTGYFALDFGLDVVGGRDYHGRRRTEVPLTVNALVFVNPRDRAQFYMLGGLGWSSARVEVPYEVRGANYSESGSTIDRYGYFGVQLGAGFEFRVAKKTALNVDLIGFVRGRTDQAAAYNPEFTDPATGRRTNTSGGGLLRGGLTFYW